MTDARLVRDLLDANLELTKQLVELARVAIGAPQVLAVDRASMEIPSSLPSFAISAADDWEDIPERPMGQDSSAMAQVIEFGRPGRAGRAVSPDLPLHISEEEEDLRFAVAHELAPPAALTDLLKTLQAPSVAVEIDPLA